MTTEVEYEQKYEDLLEAISQVSAVGWVDGWRDAPHWFQRAVRNLLQVVDDREVEFVAARPLIEGEGASPGMILIFCRGILVRADIEPASENPSTKITVTPRNRLTSLTTTEPGLHTSYPRRGYWVTGQTVTLTYDGIDPITLPLADRPQDRATSAHTGKLLRFLPSLLDDLSGASR